MNLLRRWTGRFGPIFLVTAVAGALLSFPNVALGTLPVTESFFASVAQPIGVAASPSKLLVTHQCGQVVSIGPTGTMVSLFATLPSAPEGCSEAYIATAPAAADFLNTPAVSDPLVCPTFPTITSCLKFTPNEIGFASGFVYVTQGSRIIKIAPDGSAQASFINTVQHPSGTLSPCGPSHTGITFDKVGTFGFHMIVVCNNGRVWLLDKDGQTVTVAGALTSSPFTVIAVCPPPGFGLACTIPPGPFEGPDVARLSGFSPFNGQLLVAAENAGEVFAVNSSGATSTVASVGSAEAVAVIPLTVCSFGSSGGAYFSAVFGNNSITKVLMSDFTGLSGALVPSEFGTASNAGIVLLSSDGTTLNTTPSTFSSFFAVHEGAAFCNNSVPTDITGFIQREPVPVNADDLGVLTAIFCPTTGFDPFKPNAVFRAGIKGIEDSFAFFTPQPVLNGCRDVKFFMNKLGIREAGLCPVGVPCLYSGLLHFKVDPGPGDSACGDG